jgi:hypothetical protein
MFMGKSKPYLSGNFSWFVVGRWRDSCFRLAAPDGHDGHDGHDGNDAAE